MPGRERGSPGSPAHQQGLQRAQPRRHRGRGLGGPCRRVRTAISPLPCWLAMGGRGRAAVALRSPLAARQRSLPPPAVTGSKETTVTVWVCVCSTIPPPAAQACPACESFPAVPRVRNVHGHGFVVGSVPTRAWGPEGGKASHVPPPPLPLPLPFPLPLACRPPPAPAPCPVCPCTPTMSATHGCTPPSWW